MEHSQYYKAPMTLFGLINTAEGRYVRSKKVMENRQKRKDDMLTKRRGINDDTEVFEEPPIEAVKLPSRYEKLLEWKENRLKKKEQLKTKQPFVVRSKARIPTLEEMNQGVKSFASSIHIFKAPIIKTKSVNVSRPVTRSQTKKQSPMFKEKKVLKRTYELDTQIKKHKSQEDKPILKRKSTVIKPILKKEKQKAVIPNKPTTKAGSTTTTKKNVQSSSKALRKSTTKIVAPASSNLLTTTKTKTNVSNDTQNKEMLHKKSMQKQLRKKGTATVISENANALHQNILTPIENVKCEVPFEIQEPEDSNLPSNNKSPNAEIQTKKSPLTPKNQTATTSYVSPFVTTSRGKENAVKEYKRRMSQGGILDEVDLSITAKHFRDLLENQIDAFNKLCDKWIKYKDSNLLTESAIDMINVPVGQTRLLINQKFVQFTNLINSFEDNSADPPTTKFDLHGFWDLLQLQTDNIYKRFENLQKICDNNWKEILPVAKVINKSKPVKVKKKIQGSSLLKDAIRAARAKKIENECEQAVAIISTPSGVFKEFLKRNAITPLNKNVKESGQRRYSSPGLHIMKASAIAKKFENMINETTPKSILKRTAATTARQNKCVVFISKKDSNDAIKHLKF